MVDRISELVDRHPHQREIKTQRSFRLILWLIEAPEGRRSGGSEFCEQVCNDNPGSRWPELAYVIEGFCKDDDIEKCATWRSTRNIFVSKPHWSFEYHHVLHELENFFERPYRLKKIADRFGWHHVNDMNALGHGATLQSVLDKVHQVRDLFCRRYPADGGKIRIVRVDVPYNSFGLKLNDL
eukprot:Nk52_evm18s216 gene=Nk52_evmTU18s216